MSAMNTSLHCALYAYQAIGHSQTESVLLIELDEFFGIYRTTVLDSSIHALAQQPDWQTSLNQSHYLVLAFNHLSGDAQPTVQELHTLQSIQHLLSHSGHSLVNCIVVSPTHVFSIPDC